jgi:hypothetical protein
MNGLFKVLCVTATENESKDGRKFYQVVVAAEDTVLKFSCTEEAYRVLHKNKLKNEVEVVIKISEYDGAKSLKIVEAREIAK